jgi:hypothetical protein
LVYKTNSKPAAALDLDNVLAATIIYRTSGQRLRNSTYTIMNYFIPSSANNDEEELALK